MSKRVCVGCKHWYFWSGHYWSEETGGDDWQTECYKGHWALKGSDVYHDDLANKLIMADTCQDFELADYAKEELRT